jgi:endonuclease G
MLIAWPVWADAAKDCKAVLGTLDAPSGPKGLVAFCSPNAGYFTLQDTKALEPRVVVERVNGQKVAGGCVERTNNFHAEPNLPSAKPSDYLHSGYDLGHQAPAEDFDWSKDQMPDSFSTANMAPQKPGLNRQGWKGLETWVRAAALSNTELVVMTGPIIEDGAKAIGADKIAVPTSFFKVVYDEKSSKVWAFVYPNEDVPENAPPAKYQSTLGAVERASGLRLLGADMSRSAQPILPPADEAAWREAHSKACK